MPGSSQHRFTKGKSDFTSLTAFYDEMILLEDERRSVDAVYLASGKVFQTVAQNILIDKMMNQISRWGGGLKIATTAWLDGL